MILCILILTMIVLSLISGFIDKAFYGERKLQKVIVVFSLGIIAVAGIGLFILL